jgi:hypothetical protein
MYFCNLHVIPAVWGNYVQHVGNLMMGRWEAETTTENRAAVDPLFISLDKT